MKKVKPLKRDQDIVKVWDKILSPLTYDGYGNEAFAEDDCLNSAINLLHYGLAEKIKLGVVMVWDTNEQLWTNFYAWHCWAVTKEGQPFDLSVNKWENVFNELDPAIIPEKNPLDMSCETMTIWNSLNSVNDRNITKADAIYLNGGFNYHHYDLIPEPLKKIIVLSGKENGFTLEQSGKVFDIFSE